MQEYGTIGKILVAEDNEGCRTYVLSARGPLGIIAYTFISRYI